MPKQLIPEQDERLLSLNVRSSLNEPGNTVSATILY